MYLHNSLEAGRGRVGARDTVVESATGREMNE